MNSPHDPALLFAQVALERQAESLAMCWPELAVADRQRQFELASVGSLKSAMWGAWRGERLVGAVRLHVQEAGARPRSRHPGSPPVNRRRRRSN